MTLLLQKKKKNNEWTLCCFTCQVFHDHVKVLCGINSSGGSILRIAELSPLCVLETRVSCNADTDTLEASEKHSNQEAESRARGL